MTDQPADAHAGRGVRLRRALRSKSLHFAIGAALLSAAVWVVWREEATLARALGAAREASPTLVLAVLLLPVLNLVFVSLSFSVLTAPRGRVGIGEMLALIASAWMLNYLPLRPGLVGRIAYHKKVNGIGVKDSVRVLGEAVALSAGASGLLVLLAVVVAGAEHDVIAWVLLPIPGVLGLTLAAGARGWGGESGWGGVVTRLALAGALRYADMLVWVARYAAVFAMVGHPLSVSQAVTLAAVSQVALLFPLVGNGLGLREWAIGLAAVGLPAWLVQGPTPLEVPEALAADLMNRAAELLIAVPAGLAALAWLSRRVRARSRPK